MHGSGLGGAGEAFHFAAIIGAGGDTGLRERVRQHGNFIEWGRRCLTAHFGWIAAARAAFASFWPHRCQLTTEEVGRAFLDAVPTMGQRLSRARAKVTAAGIPFAVPGPNAWDDRLRVVLTTIYLIFTTGYTARPDEPRAIFLSRLLAGLELTDSGAGATT